jgi:hypothetical protein
MTIMKNTWIWQLLVVSKPEYEHSKLVELLLSLQEDAKLLAAFDKDPDRVMLESGITSEKYRNILNTRDRLKIHLLLEETGYDNNARKRRGREELTLRSLLRQYFI